VELSDRQHTGGQELDVVVNLATIRLLNSVWHYSLPAARLGRPPTGIFPILRDVETPEFFDLESPQRDPATPDRYPRPAGGGIWAAGDRITWVSALVLCVSAFTGWYAGSGVGVKLAVIGWHTGVLGKLVFFVGLALLALVALREAGFELPPAIPESLVVLALGALALIFVLIRLISIPDSVLPADGRGIGIYISLAAALGVVLGGLLRAAEEL
jgi:hypothetical protein